jgi:hypothetical protein
MGNETPCHAPLLHTLWTVSYQPLIHVTSIVKMVMAEARAEWQPWLAVLGVACLAGGPLSRIAFRLNVDLGQQLMAYYTYRVHFGTLLTPQQDMAWLLCLAIALLLWSCDVRIRLGSAFRPCRVAHVVRVLPHGFGFRIGKIHTVREYDPA